MVYQEAKTRSEGTAGSKVEEEIRIYGKSPKFSRDFSLRFQEQCQFLGMSPIHFLPQTFREMYLIFSISINGLIHVL
jgi:hypothetical protein